MIFLKIGPLHANIRPTVAGTRSVYYMWRGCQRESSPTDGCVSKVHYEDCRETCSTDLCNGDDMSVSATSTLHRQSPSRNSDTTGSSAPYLMFFTQVTGGCCVLVTSRLRPWLHVK